MTGEQFLDALNQLPEDLIAQTQRRRSAHIPAPIPWRKYLSLAACLALCLWGVWGLRQLGIGGSAMEKSTATECREQRQLLEEANSIMEAAEEAPLEEAFDAEAEESLTHSHTPAQETPATGSTAALCGNTGAVIHLDGTAHRLSGEDAVTLTILLQSLPYEESALCRCDAEFTADTETVAGYQISLTNAFVRYDGAQAALSQSQIDTLSSIVQALGS